MERTIATAELLPEDGARELPQVFIDWQVAERRELFAALDRGDVPRSFAAHLPVVSTLGPGAFPIHSATKGAGLTPRDDLLPELVREIDRCLASCEGRPWPETLGRRIATARLLYDYPERIDPRRLGLIEIFRGQTYRNALREPRVTLLFTGPGPRYPSFQVNGIAEIVEHDDLRFRFVRGMRLLFERDRFHIQQPGFSVGYLVWVHEIADKTPRTLGRHVGPTEEAKS